MPYNVNIQSKRLTLDTVLLEIQCINNISVSRRNNDLLGEEATSISECRDDYIRLGPQSKHDPI